MIRSLIRRWNDQPFQFILGKVELLSWTVKFYDTGKLEQASLVVYGSPPTVLTKKLFSVVV